MKEIKFRAWNKACKEMEYSFCVAANGKVFGVSINMLEAKVENVDLTSYLEIMQYTELKDKNGKEIYEGDILKTSTGSDQVLWDSKDGLWCFDDRHPLYFADINQREVIGNIYENPELLKEE